MIYRPKTHEEWSQEPESSVIDAEITGNTVKITWLYAGRKKQFGAATSRDGVNFDGQFSERMAGPSERGRFNFILYAATTGERLLVGTWHTEKGEEKKFLLVLEPRQPNQS